MSDGSRIDEHAVRRAYARWAPIYDLAFGPLVDDGRRRATAHINAGSGSVLEVGVGTGLALDDYAAHLEVTGIDLSPEMLEKARARVARKNLRHVKSLDVMDAGALAFEDESFDWVVAMYVLTTVPDPARVMAELERVVKPAGEVIIVNHFSAEGGVRYAAEKALSPLADWLGWRPEFPVATLIEATGLELAEQSSLRPFGLFTFLRFRKPPAGR